MYECSTKELPWPTRFVRTNKGSSRKDVRTKLRKIDPSPFVCKMSALAQPPCPCGHTLNFKKFLHQKVRRCPHLKKPLLPSPHWANPPAADVFDERSLIAI